MRKKTKKADKKKPVFELIPLPSGLKRMTRADLIEQVEFMINISNLILERKAQDKLSLLDEKIRVRTLEAQIVAMETYIEQLKEKNYQQNSRHKIEVTQAASEFGVIGQC